MYTIAEFRKHIRKAFNDADEGHEVVIVRYGQKFQLVSLVDKPLGNHSFESTPASIEPIINSVPEFREYSSPKETLRIGKQKNGVYGIGKTDKTCKHGAAIGFCKFGCKK